MNSILPHDGVFFLRRKYLVFHLSKSTETSFISLSSFYLQNWKLPFQQLQTNFWRRLSLFKASQYEQEPTKKSWVIFFSPVTVILCLQECAETLPNPGKEVVFQAGGENFLKSGRPHWKRFGQDMLHNQIHKIERLFKFRPNPAFTF